MYCPQCGKKFWFRNTFCPVCRVGLVQHPPMSPTGAETPAWDESRREVLDQERDPREPDQEDLTGDPMVEEDPSAGDAAEEPTTEHSVHTDPRLTRIFTTGDPALIALAQSLLEENGIEYLTKTDVMNGLGVGAGLEEFWVRGDEAQLATDVLRDLIDASPPPEPSPEDER